MVEDNKRRKRDGRSNGAVVDISSVYTMPDSVDSSPGPLLHIPRLLSLLMMMRRGQIESQIDNTNKQEFDNIER